MKAFEFTKKENMKAMSTFHCKNDCEGSRKNCKRT